MAHSPELVYSVNLTSAAGCGLTDVVTALSFTFLPKGDLAVFSPMSLPCGSSSASRLKPCRHARYSVLPCFPQRERQRTEEWPRFLGAVKPAITTSWRFDVLIFSQLSLRTPDRYLLSARFAVMPSRSASSKNKLARSRVQRRLAPSSNVVLAKWQLGHTRD